MGFNKRFTALLSILLLLFVWNTNTAQDSTQKLDIPLGMMDPIYPDGVPPTPEQITIGRSLFFDPILSIDNTISCASCHRPEYAFSDPRPVSVGVNGQLGTRNSMSLLNAALFSEFGWDGHNSSLEEQTLAAITNPLEMALPANQIPAKVEAKYGAELRKHYAESSAMSVAKAISAYQRTLVSGNSPFDRYIYLDEQDAISESAKRGFELFLRRGRCVQCHMVRCDECHPFGGQTGFFTNNRYHNLGIGFEKDSDSVPADTGRHTVTGNESEIGAFKTPSLRNVALTSPYMHDGQLETLRDVIDHYNDGGIENLYLDNELEPLNLTEQEKVDLEEFLKSLTSEEYLSFENL